MLCTRDVGTLLRYIRKSGIRRMICGMLIFSIYSASPKKSNIKIMLISFFHMKEYCGFIWISLWLLIRAPWGFWRDCTTMWVKIARANFWRKNRMFALPSPYSSDSVQIWLLFATKNEEKLKKTSQISTVLNNGKQDWTSIFSLMENGTERLFLKINTHGKKNGKF